MISKKLIRILIKFNLFLQYFIFFLFILINFLFLFIFFLFLKLIPTDIIINNIIFIMELSFFLSCFIIMELLYNLMDKIIPIMEVFLNNPITIDIIIQKIDKIIFIMILIYLLFCFIIQIMMHIIIQIIVNLPIIIINLPKIIINLPIIIHNLPIIIHNLHITIIKSFEMMIELFILRIDMISSGNMFFVIMSIAIITHLFNMCIKLIIENLSIEEFDLSYKINIIFLIIIATIILNNDFCYTEEPFLHLMNNEKKGLNFEGFKEYFFCAINYRIACDFMWFILSKILDKFNNGIKFFKKIWSI